MQRDQCTLMAMARRLVVCCVLSFMGSAAVVVAARGGQQSAADNDVDCLLAQKAALTNWDAFAAAYNVTGWSRSVPVCDWTAVTCSDGGRTYNLEFMCDKGTLSGYCDTPLEGTLAPELADCRSLRTLSIVYQGLKGVLPEWSQPGAFPKLMKLNLGGMEGLAGTLPAAWAANPWGVEEGGIESLIVSVSSITGSLPKEWCSATAFQNLTELTLSGNQLNGTLEPWTESEGFPNVLWIEMRANRFAGTLPAGYGRGGTFRRAQGVYLSENRGLTGPLPPSWVFGAVLDLWLQGNNHTGTLPAEWAGNFPQLDLLYLDGNSLSGTLPPEWGQADAFPTLRQLSLFDNRLTGSIPEEWGQDSAWPALEVSGVRENPGLCGSVPANLVTQICVTGGNGCVNNTIPCPGNGAPAPAPAPAEGAPAAGPAPFQAAAGAAALPSPPLKAASDSSAPVGAIVGGVIGGVAALLAVLTGIMLSVRQRQRQRTSSARPGASDGKLATRDAGGGTSNQPQQLDEVLTFLNTHLPELRKQLASVAPAAAPSIAAGASSAGNSGSGSAKLTPNTSNNPSRTTSGALTPEVQLWEVQWEELKLGRLIGKGSFGRVYFASWRETPVAVKVLMSAEERAAESFMLPEATLQQLQSEAAVLARLRHPNVVGFNGLCAVPPCILTEFCQHGSLYDLLSKANKDTATAALLTWPLRLRMAVDAGRGLLYLHRCSPPIIHRDIKSPNFLVDEHYRIKVTDFGLAKIFPATATGSAAAPSTLSSIATNPVWLAPEVMKGERPTAASDVYAYGLVLYELLTWQLPWGGGQAGGGEAWPFRIYYQVLNGKRPVVPPREALPGRDTPTFDGLGEYCSIMQECWVEDPAQRPTFDTVVPRLKRLLVSVQQSRAGRHYHSC